MSKDLFIRVHEQMVDEYLEAHPEADWSEAYEVTSKNTDELNRRYADAAGELIDAARERAKYK